MLFSDPSPCEQLSSWPPLPPVVLTLNLQCATLLSTEHFTFTGKIISILCDVFSPLSSPRLKYLQNFPRSRVGEASCFFVKTTISTPLISSSTHFFFFCSPMSPSGLQPFLHPSLHWPLALCPHTICSPHPRSVLPAEALLRDSTAITGQCKAGTVLDARGAKRNGVHVPLSESSDSRVRNR